MEGLNNNGEVSREHVMPPEVQELLDEEEAIKKELDVAEKIIQKTREDFALTEDDIENPRYRNVVDRLNNTPEGKEILEAFFELEDEVLSVMEKFLSGKKEAKKAVSLIVHAHREIKRMRAGSVSGK